MQRTVIPSPQADADRLVREANLRASGISEISHRPDWIVLKCKLG